jgi:hypothetical protein
MNSKIFCNNTLGSTTVILMQLPVICGERYKTKKDRNSINIKKKERLK